MNSKASIFPRPFLRRLIPGMWAAGLAVGFFALAPASILAQVPIQYLGLQTNQASDAPIRDPQTGQTVSGQNARGTSGANSSSTLNQTDAARRRSLENNSLDPSLLDPNLQDPTLLDPTYQNGRFPARFPDPPTEFQRLVQASIGTRLAIFGASLFSGVPSTFAPVQDIPVPPGYVIGPGDELRIQLFGQVNRQGTYLVDRTGNIAFPDVGTLHVAGIQYSQLEAFLRSQFSRVFRNFELNVNLGQLRSIQIFVVGEARRPGSYTVSSLSTLLNALFASGGPLPQGSLRDIQVLRNGLSIVHFDLYDLLLRGDKSKDIPLAPGDVLFIPAVGPQVAVSGSVNTPAIYEITPGATVAQLIQFAGGTTGVALGSKVRLDRVFEHTMRSIVDVDPTKSDPAVINGDILSLYPISDQYKDAVTLRGNVALPGRYVWHAGMRITDLVPNRDLLITRNYYRRRNALGNILPDDRIFDQAERRYDGTSGRGSERRGSPSGDYPRSSSYPNPSSYPDPTADQTNTPYLNRNADQNGDIGSVPLQGSDTSRLAAGATAPGTATASSRGGNSLGTALTGSNSVFPPANDVVLSAPDLDWSYAVIERLNPQTLTTSLLPFHPGRLFLDGDQTQNLVLQTGDVVTFFSTADLKVPTSQQTRFVRLEGEFAASGVYSVEPGETLRHLLARAGGFTSDAYLYGSEFTRQSTRRLQQQRLNEYADNLESQVAISSASQSARAVTDRDAAAAAASSADARTSIARLRRVVPLGRIVLALRPDSRGVDAVPDLPLEDGDRFVVPHVPSTVSVEGQVYSANAFVFVRSRRERDYLREAGGPDRGADRKRAFILRADGSVFSTQYGNVSRATIFPGDTIIMPPRLVEGSLLRNLLDISNIVGQFGLGAAAIRVLR